MGVFHVIKIVQMVPNRATHHTFCVLLPIISTSDPLQLLLLTLFVVKPSFSSHVRLRIYSLPLLTLLQELQFVKSINRKLKIVSGAFHSEKKNNYI